MTHTNATDLAPDVAVSTAMPADYLELLKPRVMRLVVFTALVGLLLAPGPISPWLAAVAVLCIAVGAGASGALNQWYDADIDAVMSRTRDRPVPRGEVEASSALGFGTILSMVSVVTLGLFANWVAAALLAFTIFFYAVVYTVWLKRRTPQNIVIGGAAGALPPVIGWAAVTGTVAWESVVLFLLIFVWTPPHFWALALFRERDYADAQVPMLPNVAGVRATKRQILGYSVVVAVVGVLPFALGFAGPTYAVASLVLGAAFVFYAWNLYRAPDDDMAPARKLFFFSLVHLTALFSVLFVQAVLWRSFEVSI